MTKTIKVYLGFVVLVALILVGLMFSLNPEMIIPSIIGYIIVCFFIFFFFQAVSVKTEKEQKKIAKSSIWIGEVIAIIFLVFFFIFAAKRFDMPLMDFLHLWFG